MAYVEIARVGTVSAARVLATALRAHGFHPLEGGEGGLPGVGSLAGTGLVPLSVPEEEAADARVLATALVAEMEARSGEPE